MRRIWTPLHQEQRLLFPSGRTASIRSLAQRSTLGSALVKFNDAELELPEIVGVVKSGESPWILTLAGGHPNDLLLAGAAILYRVTDSGCIVATVSLPRPAPLGNNADFSALPFGKRTALVCEEGIILIGRDLKIAWTVAKTKDERVLYVLGDPLSLIMSGPSGTFAVDASGARIALPASER